MKDLQNSAERSGGILETWKRFNKVSAFVLAAAGVVLEQPVLLALAGIDVLQNHLINRWQNRRRKSKKVGQLATASA